MSQAFPASSELRGTWEVSPGWPLGLVLSTPGRGSARVLRPPLGLQSYLFFVSGTEFRLEVVAGAWAGLGVSRVACSALSCSRTGPRKQPPHPVEVEAMEQNISRICHKIYFPNDTSEVSPCPPRLRD